MKTIPSCFKFNWPASGALLYALVLLCMGLVSGCGKDSFCNCFETKGRDATEERALRWFNTIDMDNNVDVILRRGSDPAVKVTCGGNLIDGIRTEVRDSVLFIKNVNKCNWLRDFKNKFIVEVVYPDLVFITNRGSGNLTCADTITVPDFQLDNWNGTGELNLKINIDYARFKLHTGPADITASGKARQLYIYSAGNGFVKADDVESDLTIVSTKSTGDCTVKSLHELYVSIRYNGDVYYTGNPPVVQSEISGNGKLIPF